MKLILIFGDSAVGKMTVGQELMEMTALRLFHNHMTIEPVLDIFGYFDVSTIIQLREVILKSFAKTNLEGLIFTFMWALDQKEDWEYVEKFTDIFKKEGADIYYVELYAPLEVRLERNKTENRLKHKASKRNIEISNQRLIHDSQNHRFVSFEGEMTFENYIKIDNTHLTAKQTAEIIKETFKLT